MAFLFSILTLNVHAAPEKNFCGKAIYVATATDGQVDWVSSVTLVKEHQPQRGQNAEDDTSVGLRDPQAIVALEELLDVSFEDYAERWFEPTPSLAQENVFICLDQFELSTWRERSYAHQVESIRVWRDFEFIGSRKLR